MFKYLYNLLDFWYTNISVHIKIRIDYILIDDINMYMVFDLLCEEEQSEYNLLQQKT